MEKLPRYQEFIEPMLTFLVNQTGPASNSTINDAVAGALNIPPNLLNEIHSGTRTVFQYRMAWARTKAKADGKISSPSREMWIAIK
jgi:restriction endonuclease Mrr